MSFSAEWLEARRDADLRARNKDLAKQLASQFSDRQTLKVLDLGCGTGANLAATGSLLDATQHWVMADNDPDLLARIESPGRTSIKTVETDLASSLDRLFRQRFDLVTASALFDLAGAAWMDELIGHVTASNAVFYTVLTYDGEERWEPPHRDDEAVLSAFHADQHRDKGLGPALGPTATAYLRDGFESAGYAVQTGRSAWDLEASRDAALIGMLSEGIRDAVEPRLGETANRWFQARQSTRKVVIGHQDLLAFPQR